MASINSVILMGSAVDVGQLRYSGQLPILDIQMMVKKFWKDKEGQHASETTIPLTLFGPRATMAADRIRVGMQVVVKGEMICQEKESKQTGKVYLVMEVRVNEMQII